MQFEIGKSQDARRKALDNRHSRRTHGTLITPRPPKHPLSKADIAALTPEVRLGDFSYWHAKGAQFATFGED